MISALTGSIVRVAAIVVLLGLTFLNKSRGSSSSGCDLHGEVELLHIGKCGGGTVNVGLMSCINPQIHVRPVTQAEVNSGHRFIVVVRDPISRFISAFNFRHPNGGWKTPHFQSDEEKKYGCKDDFCLLANEEKLYRCYETVNDLANGLLQDDDCSRFFREHFFPRWDDRGQFLEDHGISHITKGFEFYFGPDGATLINTFITSVDYLLLNSETLDTDILCAVQWVGFWGDLILKKQHAHYPRSQDPFYEHINETGLPALEKLFETEYRYYRALQSASLPHEKACPSGETSWKYRINLLHSKRLEGMLYGNTSHGANNNLTSQVLIADQTGAENAVSEQESKPLVVAPVPPNPGPIKCSATRSASLAACDAHHTAGALAMSPYDLKIISNNDLIDNRRKILLNWTPKAGCTAAVKMFLADMGIREGEHYTGWAHDFRIMTFYTKCGRADPCVYQDPSWYRLKIVRNPYDRVVSSYIHILSRAHSGHEHFKNHAHVVLNKTMPHVSFNDFLMYIEKCIEASPANPELYDNDHLHWQCMDFEYKAWLEGRSVFNRVVKVEDLDNGLAEVNREAHTTFSSDFTSSHYAVRKKFSIGDLDFEDSGSSLGILTTRATTLASIKSEDMEATSEAAAGGGAIGVARLYVGRTPWGKIKEYGIPEDYGAFYDESARDLVTKIFKYDVLVYNYSFPFDIDGDRISL